MENNRDEMDGLLKQHMQFSEGELPEPDTASYRKLRNKIKPKRKNFFLRALNIEIKLYQAALAVVGVALIFIALRPLQAPTDNNTPGSGSFDTAAAFKGSSLKHDSFLVRNFSTTVY